MSTERYTTLPLRLFYGSGSVAEGVKNTAFNVFLLFYYNQVLGVSGTLTGLAIFVALVVDAITDPLIGSLSDNHVSRWGRRHPFMYTSAVPMAVCFWLLFNPPALSDTGLFVWLCVFAVGVRASMTLYMIPSSSMAPELTPNYDERTSLLGYRYLFGWMGGLGASVIGYFWYFAGTPEFPDGQLDPSRYGPFALTCGALIFGTILLASVGTHSVIPRLSSPKEKTRFSARRLAREMQLAFANHSYRVLVIALLFASIAGGFNDVVGLYVNTYFWGFSTQEIGTIALSLAISPVIGFAVAPILSQRTDKRRSALAIATFAVLWGPLPIFLRLVDLMPPNGSPLLLPIMALHAVIVVAAVVAIGILLSSMVADTVDENELATGKRQEGVFVSAIAFTAKAASGVGGLFAGIALDLIAFPRGVDPGAVPPGKITSLGIAVGPGLFLFYLVLLWFLSRYRMTREDHEQIRLRLASRGQAS